MPCNMHVLMIGKIIQEQKMILAKKDIDNHWIKNFAGC